jgi:NAD(P)-dependent dehydrogenase (short-subunit alcohol dehydrogenase family)
VTWDRAEPTVRLAATFCKRIADPLEIAKLAVYLASDDSAYVVGADFLIDGGVAAISAVDAGASLQRVEAVLVPAQARDGSP